VDCPRCSAHNPEMAHYCYRCGQDLRRADARSRRADSFAVQSAESVTQFALISTILPHTNRRTADSYRWAFLATSFLVLVLTFLGLIPAAVVAGAFLVPITYLVYLYDVNLWEDAPLPAVLALFVVTGLLSALVSLLFFRWAFHTQFAQFRAIGFRGTALAIPLDSLLVFAVLLPIVAEVVKNIGPLWLASRPKFDDMIDGLTFGIAAGTAYAAAESLVVFAPVLSQDVRTTAGISVWVPIVLNLMIVKPLIYGTATGIAVATFSGRGEGHDGFTSKYAANFAFAAGMNILYWLGIRLLSYVAFGQALGLLWGVAILAVLIIRARVLMHTALLETAVEDAANGRRSKAATTDGGFCPECEMPLLPDALFCIVCGESVRATSNAARRSIREPSPEGSA
jgi:hypothetical protein